MVDRFEQFSLAIMEISRHWHKLAADEMETHGLKGSHAVYLLTMYRYPEGITAPRLCEICGKDKSDVCRMMPILEEKGLVKKEGVHQNLYRGGYKLTQEGRTVAEYVRRRAALAVELAGRDITPEKREIFYEVLGTIVGNLREIIKDGLPRQ